jgi:hypothetical protein
VKGKIQRFNNQLNHSLKKICCKFYLSIGQPLPDNLQDFTFQQENQEAASNYVGLAESVVQVNTVWICRPKKVVRVQEKQVK